MNFFFLTSGPGLIVFASMIKSSLKCTLIYEADVKSRQHFQDKNIVTGSALSMFTFLLTLCQHFFLPPILSVLQMLGETWPYIHLLI